MWAVEKNFSGEINLKFGEPGALKKNFIKNHRFGIVTAYIHDRKRQS